MNIPDRLDFAKLSLDNKPSFVHLSVDKDGVTEIRPSDLNAERYFTESTERTRTELRTLVVNSDGLNIQRLDDFRNQINASQTPIQFLDTDSYERVLQESELKSDSEGIYIAELRMAFVRRNIGLEALNGVAITESFAVHEAAHSSHIEAPIRVVHKTTGRFRKKSVIEMSRSRSGFNTAPLRNGSTYGYLFEEGYAELERGLYVQYHDLAGQFTAGASNYELVKDSPIPLHYWYKREESEKIALTIAPGALAATVLEILTKQDPSLISTLRKGRQDVHGLRNIAQRINGLIPGLYPELQHANESTIINALGKVTKHYR
ncbi:MAG: hypothetical protein WAW80_04070 [Candidatus Saccharimonadales bacterium]